MICESCRKPCPSCRRRGFSKGWQEGRLHPVVDNDDLWRALIRKTTGPVLVELMTEERERMVGLRFTYRERELSMRGPIIVETVMNSILACDHLDRIDKVMKTSGHVNAGKICECDICV